MSRKNHDEIVLIVDKSGSMNVIREDTIGTLNTFLESQRKVAGRTASLTVVYFNDGYKILHNGVELGDVVFDVENYKPEGTTALFDAIGRTVDTVGSRLESTPENQRPEKVIVAIMTDGMENSSEEFSHYAIQQKIKHQTDVYKWIFDFLGANIDNVKVAKGLGIKYTMSFVSTPKGMKDLTPQFSSRITSYRTGK